MGVSRAHIQIPNDLLDEIDALVGPRKRSAFIVKAAEKELHRLRLLAALDQADGAWKDEDHPELRRGSAQWVRKMRSEDERLRATRSKG